MISTLTQQQNELSNDIYHEKFNTKMRTAIKMEVNFDHEIIWKHEAKKVRYMGASLIPSILPAKSIARRQLGNVCLRISC
jgi:hypothetical protein